MYFFCTPGLSRPWRTHISASLLGGTCLDVDSFGNRLAFSWKEKCNFIYYPFNREWQILVLFRVFFHWCKNKLYTFIKSLFPAKYLFFSFLFLQMYLVVPSNNMAHPLKGSTWDLSEAKFWKPQLPKYAPEKKLSLWFYITFILLFMFSKSSFSLRFFCAVNACLVDSMQPIHLTNFPVNF